MFSFDSLQNCPSVTWTSVANLVYRDNEMLKKQVLNPYQVHHEQSYSSIYNIQKAIFVLRI